MTPERRDNTVLLGVHSVALATEEQIYDDNIEALGQQIQRQ